MEPTCYGTRDMTDTKCTGGYDPTYDENRGIRQRCSVYDSCGTKKEHLELIKLGTGPRVTQASAPSWTPPSQTPQYMQPRAVEPAVVFRPPPTYTPPPVQHVTVAPPSSYAAPRFLSHPEPILPNDTFFSHFRRVLLRSAFKGVGLGVAEHMDYVPMKTPK